MNNIFNQLKIGQIYSGFKVIEITEIDAYKSTGIFLRHEKTGMEVFHMLNDDEENLFSFGFRTPPFDSTGAAHILEHSVLCGSEKYPLKDPFIRLANQSVKTFLNAMTFPDKTVYPASSISETDYFNLMSVYGDAVFSPLLTKETFMQEAHRFELDEKGRLSIQGVVFNEMKGSYSSFDSVAFDHCIHTILPNSCYSHDSGGDPACIPDITLEKLKAFHSTYYHPSNCCLFLYGNIPTEKQLNFIAEHFLDKANYQKLNILPTIQKTTFAPYFAKPKYAALSAPATKSEKGSTVLVSWNFGEITDPEKYMQAVLLTEILMGHDGSPINKALVESSLGEDVSPNSGLEGELRYLVMTIGLRGVKKNNGKKVEKIILQVINNLIKNGIDETDIQAAVMAVDFLNREIRRGGGPYSLTLMRRAYRGWMNGEKPTTTLTPQVAFEKIKQQIKEDKNYIVNLLKKFFIENNSRCCLTVTPKASYNKRLDKSLKKIIHNTLSKLSSNQKKEFYEKVVQDKKQLNEYQQKVESKELCALLPHLKPSDLSKKVDVIDTQRSSICSIPTFITEQPVNKIVYLKIGFPVDVLSPDDYKYLPFFSSVLLNVGFNEKNWVESASLSARYTGSYDASLFTSSVTPYILEKAKAQDLKDEQRTNAIYNEDSVLGRSWLFITINMLEEVTENAIHILFDNLKTPDFFDETRISDLLIEYKNDFTSSVIESGNDYAASRVGCTVSRSKAVNEIWTGLSQLYYINELLSESKLELSKRFCKILNTIVNSGMVINITAEKSGIEKTKEILQREFQNSEFYLGEPKQPYNCKDEDFYNLTRIEGEQNPKEAYIVPTQVGYSAMTFKASEFATKESIVESVYSHWLTNTVLWEKIRTIGGAYGAFSYIEGIEGLFIICTYRDPNPEKSIAVIQKILTDNSICSLDDVELERIITGSYSKEIQPRSPSSKGSVSFIRNLYGITDEQRKHKLDWLLSITLDDINQAKQQLAKYAIDYKSAIICSKTEENTGKIIILPL